MADVWRSRTERLYRRDRSVGTIDGRLIQASRKPDRDETRRPDDHLRNIQFNSGGSITEGESSPAYVVTHDGIIVGLSLTVKGGGATASIYINGNKKSQITRSNSGDLGFAVKEDLDIGVDADDVITVVYTNSTGSPSAAVTTVNLLED